MISPQAVGRSKKAICPVLILITPACYGARRGADNAQKLRQGGAVDKSF